MSTDIKSKKIYTLKKSLLDKWKKNYTISINYAQELLFSDANVYFQSNIPKYNSHTDFNTSSIMLKIL